MVYFLAFVIAVTAHLLYSGFTHEATLTLSKPNGTIRTIKSDHGDVIDCVEIYKQIAFDNPFMKSPQVDLYLEEEIKSEITLLKNKYVQDCPFRTVPILRSQTYQTKSIHQSLAIKTGDNRKLEHATVWTKRGVYYGASAKYSVWNPHTEKNDYSVSTLWLINNPGIPNNLNTIEAGWHVYPEMYGDNKTRFFVYWTSDHFNQTGCYNLQCKGFVQLSRTIALGHAIENISIYNKTLEHIHITIFRSMTTGNWFLQLDKEVIGYWPPELFNRLNASASHVSWGGQVFYNNSSGQHTKTEMGSGHFAGEGYGRAGHIRNLMVKVTKKNSSIWEVPQSCLRKSITNPKCYSLNIPVCFKRRDKQGIYFYYGGPGFSATCP